MQDGDVVRLGYTLYVEGKPFDTNDEAQAKKLGIAREGKRYRPLTVTLGQGMLLPKLEEAVKTAKKGADLKVELAAKDAYGEREATKVKDIPMAQFKRQKVEPKVGMEVNLEGGHGHITRVAGGRVRVDMNHDLAGKSLTYELHVMDVLTSPAAKCQAVVDHFFPSGGHAVEVGDDAVTVTLPDMVKFDRDWPMHKFRLVAELRAATQTKKAIRLIEAYPVMPEPASGEEE
jgi:FKBP-type peptidyl-prolyl cis-trans isomerase 2